MVTVQSTKMFGKPSIGKIRVSEEWRGTCECLRFGCEVMRQVLLILAASSSMDVFTISVRSCLFHLWQSAIAVLMQRKNGNLARCQTDFLFLARLNRLQPFSGLVQGKGLDSPRSS